MKPNQNRTSFSIPTKPTRRQFLAQCGALTLAASVASSAVFPSGAPLKEVPLDQLGLPRFAALVNTVFTVREDSGAEVPLQLVEVKKLSPPRPGTSAPDARNEKFSLLFRGARSQRLGQDTYWFEHEDLGRFAMFIAPVGRTNQSHLDYEAIFNRPPAGAVKAPPAKAGLRQPKP